MKNPLPTGNGSRTELYQPCITHYIREGIRLPQINHSNGLAQEFHLLP